VVKEFHVSRAQPITFHKFFVSRWTLFLGVARQHALNTHAHALNILNWTPALLTKEVETNKAVRVNVRVNWDRAIMELDERNFGWF
jgi:hypothetical protein